MKLNKRILFWVCVSLALSLVIGSAGLLIRYIHQYPKEVILKVSGWSHGEVRYLENAHWTNLSTLEIEGLWIGNYIWADRVLVEWTWKDLLLNHEIQSISIDGPQLWSGHLPKSQKPGSGDLNDNVNLNLIIRRLEVNRGQLMLEDLIPGKAIPILIGRSAPLELKNIDLNGTSSSSANEIQTAETPEIVLYSSFDALAPVIGLEKLKIDFSWAGLANHRIEKIEIVNPTLFLGPDLFDFADAIHPPKDSQPEKQDVNSKGWTIGMLDLLNGRLTINAFGQPGVTLPFYFNSTASNIESNHLEQLSLSNAIHLNASTYTFPDIQVVVKGLNGKIEFGLPIKNNSLQGKNLVQTVRASTIAWKGLEVTDPWLSVTFDRNGIYTDLGGKFYGGDLTAEGMILYDGGFPWSASFYGRGVNMAPVTDSLVHDHFTLSGTMDADLQVKARAQAVEVCKGKLKLKPPGKMVIRSIDKVIENLPASWNSFKRSGATVALNAFQTYNFTHGELTFAYGIPTSEAKLDLQGAEGRRLFDIRWHQESK